MLIKGGGRLPSLPTSRLPIQGLPLAHTLQKSFPYETKNNYAVLLYRPHPRHGDDDV